MLLDAFTHRLSSSLISYTSKCLAFFDTHLASPLWVINQAQWIPVEQGPCTLAVVKRYWSMPRMPQIAEFLVMKLAIGKMNTQRGS